MDVKAPFSVAVTPTEFERFAQNRTRIFGVLDDSGTWFQTDANGEAATAAPTGSRPTKGSNRITSTGASQPNSIRASGSTSAFTS
jgi:hypothetical protein